VTVIGFSKMLAAMNWRRGLLRIWLVLTVAWFVLVAGYGFLASNGRLLDWPEYVWGHAATLLQADPWLKCSPYPHDSLHKNDPACDFWHKSWWDIREATIHALYWLFLPPFFVLTGALAGGFGVQWTMRGFKPLPASPIDHSGKAASAADQ
jgi:hypothetical protein